MKLVLNLGPDYFVCEETGDIFDHKHTSLGENLFKLTHLWGMSPQELIERVVHDAVIEANEYLIDDEYQQPHWARTPGQTYLH